MSWRTRSPLLVIDDEFGFRASSINWHYTYPEPENLSGWWHGQIDVSRSICQLTYCSTYVCVCVWVTDNPCTAQAASTRSEVGLQRTLQQINPLLSFNLRESMEFFVLELIKSNYWRPESWGCGLEGRHRNTWSVRTNLGLNVERVPGAPYVCGHKNCQNIEYKGIWNINFNP